MHNKSTLFSGVFFSIMYALTRLESLNFGVFVLRSAVFYMRDFGSLSAVDCNCTSLGQDTTIINNKTNSGRMNLEVFTDVCSLFETVF